MRLKRLFLLVALATVAGAQTENPQRRVTVSESVTGEAFEYTITLRERTPWHEIYDVVYPSPVVTAYQPNNSVPAELYLPLGMQGERQFPALVCLHILHGSFDLERMLCSRMAQNGIAALFFKQPYYGERGGSVGKARLATDARTFVEGIEQGVEDARRAVDIMQSLPQVNPQRISITGISMGAFMSATVCGVEPRIHKAWLLLGGGDVKGVIMSAHETRKIREFFGGLAVAERERLFAALDKSDPLRAVPALRKLAAGNRLRMTNAELDQVVPPAATRRLAEAAGFADGVVWLKGMDHYSAMAALPQIMSDMVGFFGTDVPKSWQPPTNSEKSAAELLGGFLTGVAMLINGEPLAARAHLAGLEAQATVDGKEYQAQGDLARGSEGQFRLSGTFPVVGRAGMGRGEAPWLIGGGKRVFYGTGEAQKEATISALITPARLMKFKVFAGALAVAALAPDALKQYYTLGEVKHENGERVVQVRVDYKRSQGALDLRFLKDGTPLAAQWDFNGVKGSIKFSHWRLNAVADETLFEPPQELECHVVLQEDVLRMFAAAFEYVMEATE